MHGIENKSQNEDQIDVKELTGKEDNKEENNKEKDKKDKEETK